MNGMASHVFICLQYIDFVVTEYNIEINLVI